MSGTFMDERFRENAILALQTKVSHKGWQNLNVGYPTAKRFNTGTVSRICF